MNEADMYANQQVSLSIQGDDLIKRAIILIDKTYMEEIEEFATPFEYESCSLALYQTAERIPYLQHIHQIPMEELS